MQPIGTPGRSTQGLDQVCCQPQRCLMRIIFKVQHAKSQRLTFGLPPVGSHEDAAEGVATPLFCGLGGRCD